MIEPSNVSKIAIFLCTFDGGKYLAEQLESIKAQSNNNWTLYVSDDGSTDNTLAILKKFRQSWGAERLAIQEGPRKGYAANFLSLVSNNDIQADYFAFSDQDDIWKPDKLQHAVEKIAPFRQEQATLFCSRSEYVNEDGLHIGYSKTRTKMFAFNNALVENIAGGNTMVFNQPARSLLKKINDSEMPIVSHDWTLYQVVTSMNGKVLFDNMPTILYRQHGKNVIGAKLSSTNYLDRILIYCRGDFRKSTDMNLAALQSIRNEMSESAKNDMMKFQKIRTSNFVMKLINIGNPGVRRHSKLENLILLLGIIFGRVKIKSVI